MERSGMRERPGKLHRRSRISLRSIRATDADEAGRDRGLAPTARASARQGHGAWYGWATSSHPI